MALANNYDGGGAGSISSFGNISSGGSSISGSGGADDEDFIRDTNPFARQAAQGGLRGAFEQNPRSFSGFGSGSSPIDFSGLDYGTTRMGNGNLASRYSLQDLYSGLINDPWSSPIYSSDAGARNFLNFSENANNESGISGTDSGGLMDYLRSTYGEGGLNQVVDPTRMQTLYGSNGNQIGQQTYVGPRYNWTQTAVPLALGAMFAGAGAAAGGGAGTLGGSIAGGAAGGAVSGFAGSGGNTDAALRGALYGGVTGGLAQGTSSALDQWTTQTGNNPSAFTQGALTPAQNQMISQAVGRVGSTAARGGNVRDAALGAALPIVGEFGAPLVSQAGEGISSMFTGGNMPDDFNMGNSFQPTTNTQLPDGEIPDYLRELYSMHKGPMSMTQPVLTGQSDIGSMSDLLSNSYIGGTGVNNPYQTEAQDPNKFDYSLASSSPSLFGSGDGYSINSNPTNLAGSSPMSTGSDWQDQFRRFMGGNGGTAALRAFSMLNPKYGKFLQGLAGGQQGGARMSPLEAGLGALASIYTNRQNAKALKQQTSQLQSLFDGNSPYAQQMRQKLERADAAAGRRSQVGTREVELAARLAELNSRNAPQLQELNQAQNRNRAGLMQALLGYGTQSGAFSYAGRQLADLFKDA